MKEHLKRSEGQVKEYFISFCDGFTERNEDHVVDPEQRDEQQSGFSQPPERRTAADQDHVSFPVKGQFVPTFGG